MAHSQQAEAAAAERKFENTVPEHIPIKVKLKSEKSFKNLKNKNWARELEVEVKNTGDKPIYYLYVVIVMPDVLVGGYPLSMRRAYGRKELGLPDTPVQPDDVPVLLPGETLTVKLPEGQVRAYEQSRDEEGRPDPNTVEFEMQTVRFGDGTSFRGKGGMRHREATKDDPPKPRSQLDYEGCKSSETLIRHDSFRSLPAFYTDKPANLLRAYLLPMDENLVLPASFAIDLCGCQSINGCMWGEFGWSSCPCDEQFPAVVPAGGCGNTRQCLAFVTRHQECETQYSVI